MRILLLNQPFHPDEVATARIAKDLADALVRRGHEVTAIASRSRYGEVGATLPARERLDGIEVRRYGAARFGRGSTPGRIADFAGYYLRAALRAFALQRFDAVVCMTTPPYLAAVGLLHRALRGARVLYWVMDLYPDVMVAHRMIRRDGLLHRLLRRLHAGIVRRADATVVLGRCMRERVLLQGADPERVHVIPAWPASGGGGGCHDYRREWGVGGRMLVMYAGNFGLAHDVRTFLEAADALRGDDSIRFAFVGRGGRRAEVDAFLSERGLENCVRADRQPRDCLADLLDAGDVHLVTMQTRWCGLVVPSKFYGVAAAGRPTVFVGPSGSEIARSIAQWDCGVRVAPGDKAGLVRELRGLAEDPQRRRAMGWRAREAVAARSGRAALCGRVCDLLEGQGESAALAPEAVSP